MGERIAAHIQERSQMLDDPALSAFVERIAGSLVDGLDEPVTVKLIDSEEKKAYALPGGFLLVSSGLLLEAETEAELAALLAHGIAHSTARHGTRLGNLGEPPSVPVWLGTCIRYGNNFLIPKTLLERARYLEKEADLLAFQYLHRAGYEPTALADYFERDFSQHQILLGEWALRSEYKVTSSEFWEFRDRLETTMPRKKPFRPPTLLK